MPYWSSHLYSTMKMRKYQTVLFCLNRRKLFYSCHNQENEENVRYILYETHYVNVNENLSQVLTNI